MKRNMQLMLLCALPLAALSAGCCSKYLAFGTATKFGLDITQKPDETIDVTMGYDRYEVASIPVPEQNKKGEGNSATDADDSYSVLATFYVKYGNPFTGNGLRLNQFFATGMAARELAERGEMREFLGDAAGRLQGASEDAKAAGVATKKKETQ